MRKKSRKLRYVINFKAYLKGSADLKRTISSKVIELIDQGKSEFFLMFIKCSYITYESITPQETRV